MLRRRIGPAVLYFQPFVQDTLMRGVHIYQDEALAVLGENVYSVQLRQGRAERLVGLRQRRCARIVLCRLAHSVNNPPGAACRLIKGQCPGAAYVRTRRRVPAIAAITCTTYVTTAADIRPRRPQHAA